MSNIDTKTSFFDRRLLSYDGVKLVEKTNTSIKDVFTSNFDSAFLNLKIFFILLFIVMAALTRHMKFIKANTGNFVIETFIYSIAGAIPFILMGFARKTSFGDPSEKVNKILIIISMFFLYAFFNIVFEIGGLYSFMFDHELEQDDKKAKDDSLYAYIFNRDPEAKSLHNIVMDNITKSTLITVTLTIVYIIITMLLITYKVHNFSVVNYGSFSIIILIIEAILFGLCNSLPFFLIARNREGEHFYVKKNAKEVGLIFIKFFILHFVLQGSGFYNHLGYI